MDLTKEFDEVYRMLGDTSYGPSEEELGEMKREVEAQEKVSGLLKRSADFIRNGKYGEALKSLEKAEKKTTCKACLEKIKKGKEALEQCDIDEDKEEECSGAVEAADRLTEFAGMMDKEIRSVKGKIY